MAEGWRRRSLRFWRRVAVTDLALSVLAVVIWLLLGDLSLASYAGILTGLGGLTLVAGLLSAAGGFGATRAFEYQHAESTGVMTVPERAQRQIDEATASHGFLRLAAIAGVVAIVVGVLLAIAATGQLVPPLPLGLGAP